jgi:hypothetical protein
MRSQDAKATLGVVVDAPQVRQNLEAVQVAGARGSKERGC